MVFKCKMCGGDIVPIDGKNIAQCSYCKSTMTLPNLENEKIVNLYNRANDFRLSNEFDKAYGVYETILEIDNKQVEAHWGLLLCKYGVEYIDDPKTGEKIPTCHRTITTSILKDQEFKIIKENSYGESLELYTKEAKRIDEIQKGILEVSAKEDPYDVFICYKETDANGERTHDSVIAQDIYDKLTSNNYKVFFARITLENKLGSEYEPYIYSALNSSKVMLVVGTTEENFNSVWVKNEWSRYLEMMKQDKSKTLIPVYSKVDAYKLPEEFAMFQAQSMDKIGAMQDLTHGIQKLIDESKNKKATDVDVEKFKQAMDEASNLGNGRYEVVVMKEKISKGYYWLNLLLTISYIIFAFIALLANTLFSVYSKSIYSTFGFGNHISFAPLYLQSFANAIAFIAFVLPLLGRKKAKKSKPLMLFSILIETLAFAIYAKYGYVNIMIIPYLIQFLYLIIRPKWYIDSSLKLVMDKEGKDKTQENNEKIVKNFEAKDKKIIQEKYYMILVTILLIIFIITIAVALYYIFMPHSNGRNEEINQVEIIADKASIYVDRSPAHLQDTLRMPIAIAKSGEYYDIIEEIKPDKWDGTYVYKVKTEKGMEGYITSNNAKKIYGKNDPFYGKNQTNERNTSKQQLKVTTDFINIRDDASLYSEVIGRVYKDEIYTVIDKKLGSRRIYMVV